MLPLSIYVMIVMFSKENKNIWENITLKHSMCASITVVTTLSAPHMLWNNILSRHMCMKGTELQTVVLSSPWEHMVRRCDSQHWTCLWGCSIIYTPPSCGPDETWQEPQEAHELNRGGLKAHGEGGGWRVTERPGGDNQAPGLAADCDAHVAVAWGGWIEVRKGHRDAVMEMQAEKGLKNDLWMRF